MPEIRQNEWWKAQFPKCNVFFPEVECYLIADDERKDELAYGTQCDGMAMMLCPFMEMMDDDKKIKSWIHFHLQKTNPKVAEEMEATIELRTYGRVGARADLM